VPRFEGLLLDVGGVLVRTPFELHRVAESRYGLPPGCLKWMGPYDPATDPLWRRLRSGELSELDYWRRRAEETERQGGRAGGLQEYMAVCYGGPQAEFVRPEAVALVDDARAAGLRIGILTNETELLQGRAWVERVDILHEADAWVDASVTGVMKPDPGAYRLALDALGLPAERVLFVDDQPANVAGAEAVGIPAVHFDPTDVGGSFGVVRRRLGLDPVERRRGLLLDVGGVVIRHGFELRHRAEAAFGLAPGTIDRGGPFGPAPDPDWKRVEEGGLVERDYWTAWVGEIAHRAGRAQLGIQELWAVLYGGDEAEFIRPEVAALVDEADAAGVRTAMLSNDLPAFHGAHFVDQVPFFRRLGAFLDAATVGARKPDPAAYAAAVDRLGLPAHEVVFTDDLPENVAGAEAAGLPAVLFDITDPAGSVKRVRDALAGR
jgi:putative hydrolase of the HAD superfamily